ncbi:MAG: aminomethyl-transferring glycine dehydrogenase subunit GcvPA [Candidatus Koribacter versatilis]|uniref:Probable glycine dehydrogenase (decarboxylating) subunit 1 n=1 Tax=Candidatus Korobacter versatilis TaxID=658062 RepID=A0A932A9H6_9BACT|nr:aminomethyl-transferring glycine dehydrogenase subunit GcvPA [Candidatus Koribacter versatilis]
MRYLPKSPADREQMLAELGVRTIDDLFAPIPAEYRLKRDLNVPRQMAESEILDFFQQSSRDNAAGYATFLGAGAYSHYRPVVIDSLISRGEWFTAYTPYQAEIAQGTLQAIFEFQSMICELTGMEVANASMYDGSTAVPEAAMMSVRLTGRSHVVIARSVHPEYREVLRTYAQHQGLPISEVGFGENGRIDIAALDKAVTGQTACIMVQSPNFFGTIEDVAALADYAHKKGALLVVSIAEAVSLGAVRPPVEADIVAMEAQSFGVPLGFGGPYAGVIATKDKFVRQMPGRLVGQTVDRHGRRGFVLTLSTREQHIRREKATSNICTNQALVATMATIFMTIYGREGLKELAEHNLAKTAYAAAEFGKKAKVLFSDAPRFNEFVVQTTADPHQMNDRLLAQKIIGGFPLKKFYPELGNASLWCCTELTKKETIDAAVKAL